MYSEMYRQVDINCSSVEDGDQLRRVFEADFPTKSLQYFFASGNPNIHVLENDVFGDVTFRQISFRDGVLTEVQEEAMTGGSSYLDEMHFSGNNLDHFPFSTLSRYERLTLLFLSRNNFVEVPPLAIPTLFSLSLSDNPLTDLPADTLTGLVRLAAFYGSNIGISEIHAGKHNPMTHCFDP